MTTALFGFVAGVERAVAASGVQPVSVMLATLRHLAISVSNQRHNPQLAKFTLG